MADFVVCLAYAPRPNSARGPWVALVEKNTPEWQAGKLNGPGGEILVGTPADAAALHFEDETDVVVSAGNWSLLATLVSGSDTLYVMRTELAAAVDLHDTSPEPADWYANDNLPPAVVPYMRWLVPLGRDVNVNVAEDIDYVLEGSP
jgi:hypothetical protein